MGQGPDFDTLFQRRNAYFEKLIEVGGRNAQEPEPFEQRHFRIQRLSHYALVELKLAEFAIDVQIDWRL